MSEKKLGKLTVREFFARFPDDDACLTHIMEVRHGLRHVCRACGVEGTFHKLTNRKAFSCASCGDHVYPCVRTIFEDSRTPLQVWFYAIYLFVATRHGVSGKELERTLGVTYKTAWRIGQQIRKLTKADGFEIMQGHIEMDETLVGGYRAGKRGRAAEGKTIVFGMLERDTGHVWAKTIPDVRTDTLRQAVRHKIRPGSTVSTDEHGGYNLLWQEKLRHGRVNHSAKEYARYDHDAKETYSTNSIEGFWKLFKDSIRSTHIHVSQKYMDRYVKEFTFRANHRAMSNAMFDLLIGAV
jgi:transposase